MVSVRSLVPILALCLLVPSTVRADVSTGPKVALHVKAVTSKSGTICSTWQPKTTPCSQYVNKADLFQDQLVYLITTDVSADDGVSGVVCGIDYNQAAGSGVDVVQWTLCADGLQFPNAGPYGEWPMAGGGNVMTWLTCQRDTLTTAPQEGVHAIVGAFSVYAYSGDTFSITANRNLQSGPHLVIGTCKGIELELQENVAASVAFSAGAAEDGCNPCLSDCGGSFCRITPSSLFFGEVVVGSSRVQSFAIQNTAAAGGSPLVGNVQASCPDFRILSGGGPFNLAPGQSTTVTVEFAPTVGGPLQCSVSTGATCATMLLSGTGIADPPAASIEPTTLDATLLTGERKTYTFHLANQGVSNLYWSGNIEAGVGAAALLSNANTPKDLTGLRVQWDVGHGQSQTPPDSIVADLIARGATISIKSGPFTPERLAQCDVLWMSPAWISLTGPEVNALAQWIHLGGSLFLEGIGGYPYNFDFIMQALSIPLYSGFGAYMSGDTQDIGPHAITQDVHRLSLETQYSITGILLPIFELFRGPGTRSVGCAFQSQLGHVVATATLPSQLIARGDNRLFVNQAFDWLAASGKVAVSPTNGIVPPGEVSDLILTIDADGLQEGDYEVTLALLTNDIVHPELDVPIRFHVIGVPKLVGIPTQINFPPIFLGATRAETLEVANQGSGLLHMNAAVSPPFSVTPASLDLAPFGKGNVVVSFHPTQLGNVEDVLVVTSNDPNAEHLEVPLRGSALAPPVLRFSPGSLSDELTLGEEREQFLTLKNAGEYDLVWSARETRFDTEPPLLPHTFGPLTTAAHPPEGERDGADAPPPSSSALETVPLADLTGKRIIRDIRHGQSQYGWTTLTTDLEARGAEITYNSAVITPLALRDHHVFWTADIWYPFSPSEVTALRDWVLAGGALFIEGDETVFEYNQLLSSVGSGITYVSHSPFNGATNRLHPHETTEGVNAIYVEYALSVLPTTSPAQKLFESNPGETIGAAARAGQGRVVAVSDELFYDYSIGSLDNRRFANQIMDWLAEGRLLGIEPDEGVVSGGSSTRISVTLSAKRLLGGIHQGGIVLDTNDPLAENVTLPVTIRAIGVPALHVPFTSVDVGNAYLGSPVETTLVVDNPGTDYVSVTVSPASGDFSIEPETFSIPPQGTQSLTLRFLPSVLGPVSGELKFTSNDPARPVTPVVLAGSSSPPPDLTLEPTSFDAALRSGETTEKRLTLKNIGGSECRWNTSAVLAPTTATFTLHLPTGPVPDLLGEGPRPTPAFQRTTPIQAELADLSGKRILWDARHGQGYPYSWSILIADLTSRHAVVDVSTSEITLPLLRQYDAVWMIDSFQTWLPTEIAALEQWVREGGGLLIESDQATVIYNQILSGLDVGFAYVNVSANYGLTRNIFAHEVTNNVSEVYLDNPLAQLTRAVAPGRSLVDDNLEHPHAALAHVGMGRVLVLTDEDFYDGILTQGDNQLFGNQAFDWLLGGGALEIIPPSGTLLPLGAADVLVRLRAGSLSAGIHNAAVHILSNDPAKPDQEVGIRMNITGAPHMDIVEVLDFGARFTGADIETTLHVSNTGVLPLEITSADGWTQPFLADFKPVTLPPFGGVDMTVRFAPMTTGHYESQIVLVSNDPTAPARTVLLRGDALLAPDVSATPEAFSLDIVSGGNAVRYLDLGNVGGEPLEWFADVVTDSAPDLMRVVLAPHTGAVAPPANEPSPVIEAAPRTEPIEAALKDLHGVRILWDRKHGQPGSISWSLLMGDLRARGAEVVENFAPLTAQLLAGYDVFWSEESFQAWADDEIDALATWALLGGGVLLEGDQSTAEFTRILAAMEVPIDVLGIAPAPGTTDNIYPHPSTRDVTKIYVGGPLARLRADPAEVSFLIDDVSKTLIAACARQGRARVAVLSDEILPDFGLISEDNQLFGNQLVDWLVEPPFVEVVPSAGRVLTGTETQLSVAVHGLGLLGGDYIASIHIHNNDPDEPDVRIPVQVSVTGSPDLVPGADHLDFETVLLGVQKTLSLDIRNRGTDRLEVTSVTASPGEMSVAPASLNIAPGEMATVNVTFTPVVAGPVTGDLIIQSNDPDSPELHVALSAVAADIPDITLNPAGGFTENLFTGGTVSRTLNVVNQGPGELSFEIKFATTGLEGSTPAVPDILFTPAAAPMVVSRITPKTAGETGRYDDGATPIRGDPTEADSRVASVTAQNAKVLIIHAGGYVYEIKTRLDAFPDITQVDELDLYSAPAPSLQTLLAYSCVLVSGNYPMMDPVGVGNVLADYVDQGGGVVMTVPSYITQYRLGGRFWNQGYSPFSEGSGPYSGSSLGTFNAAHPIMAQVHALFGDLLGHQTVSPGSEWVANYTDGTPLCATRGTRVAAVNVFVGGSGYWTGDVPLLLHNAIMWTLGSWVAPTPASGRVPSGASMAVSLRFDAARLGGGSYQGNLEVRSNDPDESLLTLPLRLNVTAAPDIQAAPDSIAFDPLFVGLSATQSILVTNSGGVTLFVNDVQSSDPSWSSTTTSLILAPGETRTVPVTFHPQIVGALTAALHITSNDPDEPATSIVLLGQGLPAPDLEVNLDPIEAESEAGGQLTRTLHLGNSGGSVLTFFARGAESTDGTFSPRIELAPSGMSQTVVKAGTPIPLDVLAETAPSIPPTVVVNDIDRQNAVSASTEGPGIQVVALGEEVFGNRDFQFLGSLRTRGNIFRCTKRTTLFEHRLFLGPQTATQLWFMVYEGNAAVGVYQLVSASNVTPAGPGEGWYSSGRINIPLTNGRYYLFVASFEGTATYYNQQNIFPYPIPASFGELIGGVGWTWAPPVLFPPSGFIDVPDYAFGDHVAYYQTLVTQAGPLWLAVNPEEGSIPTGGGVDLSVGFDASAMNDGNYKADLVLETNDPDEAEVKVPLRFHVIGTPDIAVTPTSLDFDSVFVGGSNLLEATLANVGTDSLLIQSIQPSLPIWTVEDMPALLLPGDSTSVFIRFTPIALGAVSGTLQIVSNDPDEPSVSVGLSGFGKSAPVIEISPAQISQTVYAGEVQIVPLRVHNAGGSPLEFTVGFQFLVGSSSDWLFVEPPFGTVPAGGDLDLNVILNSRNVSPGPYAGTIDFDSNDPQRSFLQIPVQMNHVSAPNLVLSLTELQFGTAFVGYPKSLSLVARNNGNTPLAVSNLNSDEPDFGSPTGPFVLAPAESLDIVASFDPSSFGEKVGHLSFASDDPRPVAPLLLHGTGAAAPHATAAPETLVAALPPAGKARRTISLCNAAGSDLTYGIHTHPERFGGPDATGNVCVESDDPLGPVFSWIEIEQSGTPAFPSQADDENAGSFPIGFPFPYYGAVFESLRVCSNGWISFTSSAVEFADHALPSANSGTPRNLVAAFWDDWVVDPAQGGNVYVHGTPERAVIEFRNVRRFENAGGQASSFEIVLYPTGHVRFQYLTACAPGGTAGIQNAAGTQGLTVFSETRAIPAGHAVAVGPFLGHLTADTQAGHLAAGACADVSLEIDAAGLSDGWHELPFSVSSNDPEHSVLRRFVRAHVGWAEATLASVDLHFVGTGSNGRWVNACVELPAPYRPEDVVQTSIRMNGIVAPEASRTSIGDADHNGIADLCLSFERVAVEATLVPGTSVEVSVTGEVRDQTWFRARHSVRNLPPTVAYPNGGETLVAGSPVEIRWTNPEGVTVSGATLYFSGDGGMTWQEVATGVTTTSYNWSLPQTSIATAFVRVTVSDVEGVLGSDVSDATFAVRSSTGIEPTLPTVFALHPASPNPARGAASVRFDMPEQGRVRLVVYDVAGREVRVLRQELAPAGRHETTWDAHDGAGRSLGAGVYYLRMEVGDFIGTQRIILVK